MSVASVTISYGAFADARVSYLARLAGYADADHALGKLARLWGRCTFLGTDVPGITEIRAHLGPDGEKHLVECGLGEQLDDGEVRVRGAIAEDGTNRLGWYRPDGGGGGPAPQQPRPGSGRDQRSAAGASRASKAVRGPGGRFVRGGSAVAAAGPADDQRPSSGTVPLDQRPSSENRPAGGSDPDLEPDLRISPARAGAAGDSAGVAGPADDQRPSSGPATSGAGAGQAGRYARLIGDVWAYAQRTHLALRSAGIDPHAQVWSAMPMGTGADDLSDRVHELAERGMTDEQIRAACIHVINVRAAEARAFKPPHLRFFIATRTFSREGFSKALELSPEQAAAQAAQGKHGGPPRAPAPRAPEPERRRSELLTPIKP